MIYGQFVFLHSNINSYQYDDVVRISVTFPLLGYQCSPRATGLSWILQAAAHLFVTSRTDNPFHRYHLLLTKYEFSIGLHDKF